MGWYTYYNLLEKYNGDLSKATPDERENAVKSNPNTPWRAREIAEGKYYAVHGRNCSVCGKPLQSAPAKFDGDPTYVGYLPCPDHPHANL